MRRGFTRRAFLGAAAKAGLAGAVASSIPLRGRASSPGVSASGLTPSQRATLDAAVARIVPAEGPGDWSAADVGAGDYIERLLSGDGRIYAGGPNRAQFGSFRPLPHAKEMGWADEIDRLRDLYASGLAELDRRAGGDFAGAPSVAQDAILAALDAEASPFFGTLYEHTMEGVYAHPVYGGNRDYRAWNDLCYQGDVHGVRHPGETGTPWNVFGGYAPDEMSQPGECP